MKESGFQRKLKETLEREFEGCLVLKQERKQGFPDLLVIHNDKWAALECKRSANASLQPNQKTYVERLNKMSYASFIYPENEKEVIDELRKVFQS